MPARDVFVLTLSSWFGTGYLPRAPGTWGTLGSIPLWWAVSQLPLGWGLAATAVFVGLAVWVSSLAEAIYGAHDVGKIVIDESAGLLVAGAGVPFAWPEVVAAFVLFRGLDMVKPWPIRWLDENIRGGLGVVADDLAAGAVTCAVVHGARFALGAWEY